MISIPPSFLAYRFSLLHNWLSGLGKQSFEHNFIDHEAYSDYYDNVNLNGKWNRVTAPAVHLTGQTGRR